jgi:uncharacterized FlgJ-related protein
LAFSSLISFFCSSHSFWSLSAFARSASNYFKIWSNCCCV